ncbi:MAG TPA: hypothetical protein VN655_08480 [Pseudolabrys sp.]|nr:hypothetical protein [Pseudolabrys sp.]
MAGKKKRPVTPTGNPADAVPADLRRTDPDATRPDDLPEVDSGPMTEESAAGGFTPKIDGGVDQHPVHDEDQEDRTPSDYEREIDRIDSATRTER